MLRRALAALASAAALTATVAAVAPSAQADGTCDLHVTSRVAISRPYVGIPISMSGDCTDGGWANWDLYHPTQGFQDMAYFDGTTTEIWDVYDWGTQIGKQTWRPDVAYDWDSNELIQNSPVTDVRLATGAWIASSRSGSVVTLTGTSLLYSTSTDRFFKRSAGGVFQYRERGTTTWKNLKSVWTSSTGTTTMRYTYSGTRDYRFALYSTPISWDVGSATTTR
jgi:hypothetical protein